MTDNPVSTPSNPPTFKLLYLNQGTGEHGRLPPGSLVEIGGVTGSTFTVGGVPVLLANGTNSGVDTNLNLQDVYDFSTTGSINLTAGKNFTIRSSGQDAFQIDAGTGNVSISGTVNGIDLNNFFASFQAHINGIGAKHTATEVTVDTSALQSISGANVQEVIESIDTAIGEIATTTAVIQTYEFIQETAQVAWYVTHAKNSRRPTVTIYDEDGAMTLADEVKVIDANTVRIAFSTPQSGRAILLLF